MKYTVSWSEVHTASINVEAGSEEEAIAKVRDGDIPWMDVQTTFTDHIADTYTAEETYGQCVSIAIEDRHGPSMRGKIIAAIWRVEGVSYVDPHWPDERVDVYSNEDDAGAVFQRVLWAVLKVDKYAWMM